MCARTCSCWGLVGSGSWPPASSFCLGDISRRFESRKNTGVLEAGLETVEDSTPFLEKTAVCLPRSRQCGVCTCACVLCVLGKKVEVRDGQKMYPS